MKYRSVEINIYHQEQLIGYCIFDVGNNSMASILGIFHPNFSKYSIGIYSMFLELEYAKNNNKIIDHRKTLIKL